MKKIIALGGSNSKESINKELATYASSLLNNIEVSILDLNDFELPIYSVDYHGAFGVPENAHKFLKHIKSSNGIILSLAEHNGAYTTVFKNLFDWLSVIDGKLWSDKPMFLMATSPGARGGVSVLEIAKDRFPSMGGHIIADLSFPSFDDNFKEGQVINEALKSEFLTKIEVFRAAL